MDHDEMLLILSGVIKGMAKIMGEDTEIVLHDFKKEEVVAIANGQVTGREVGYRLPPSAFQTIQDLSDEEGHLVGYGSSSKFGKQLRSSHIIVKDKEGTPQALICVNQDISRLKALRDELDSLIGTRPLETTAPEISPEDENYIQKVTKQVILNAIERLKPTALNTKRAKIEIIRTLDIKNVFDVKDAVPQVCKLLSISQATLYNYLRDIRTGTAEPGKEPLILPDFLTEK